MSNPLWIFLLLLILLCLPVLPEAKKSGDHKPNKPRQPLSSPPTTPGPAKRARNRSVPGSGELTTKQGHRCTWESSGDGLVTLLVSCSTDISSGTAGEQQRYWCRYVGKPDLCQAYGTKSSQYWKQLVGKLKKRQNACDGERVLRTKTCKKAPAEAHMKLAQRSGEEAPEEKRGGRGGGKKKGTTASGISDGVKTVRKRKEEEEGEEKKKKERDERTGFVAGTDREVNDMEPVQSYCAEGWHSVCSFFVKFFEG